MREYINSQMKDRIRKHAQVREISMYHIMLHSGEVVDAPNYLVEDGPGRCVITLEKCCCPGTPHPVGTHRVTDAFIEVYADDERRATFEPPDLCPEGQWLAHEILPYEGNGSRQWPFPEAGDA